MNLYQMKTFITLAKVGHFNRAAEELLLTQPAVSTHIKALEEHYGFPLFQKLDQKYVLTEPGKILYSYAEKIFNLLNEARRSLDGFAGLDSGGLFIGASSNIGVYVLPKILGNFKNLYPKINLKVFVGPTHVIEAKLLVNEVDMGIVETSTQSAEIIQDFQWEERLVLIVSRHHPWAHSKKIEPARLKTESFISGERGSGTKRILEMALGQAAKELNVILELGSTEAVKRAVEENIGVSVVMECAVFREIKHKTLKAIPISGMDLRKTISVIHVKGKYLTPSINEFLKILRQSYKSS